MEFTTQTQQVELVTLGDQQFNAHEVSRLLDDLVHGNLYAYIIRDPRLSRYLRQTGVVLPLADGTYTRGPNADKLYREFQAKFSEHLGVR